MSNICNSNNTSPDPIPSTPECNPCDTPCSGCGSCACTCPIPPYLDEGCYSTQGSDCITYDGDTNACIPATKNATITSVFVAIFTYLKNIFNNVTSDSLVVTPVAGSCNASMTIELEPSSDSDNILTLGTDGKPYVPGTPPVYVNSVIIEDTDCLTFTKIFANGVITITPTLDFNCIAARVCDLCDTTPCPPVINLIVAVT